MDKGMRDIGFTPSKLDPCLYYRASIPFLVCIHDYIVFGPDTRAIDQVVTDLCSCSQQFTVDDQGDVGDFLGIQIQKQADGSIHLMQPQRSQGSSFAIRFQPQVDAHGDHNTPA